jgi:hypothetical protein
MNVRAALVIGLLVVLSAGATAEPVAPTSPLNTLADVGRALRSCWRWPPLSEAQTGMELTIRVSFKRNGEVFGARLTYQTKDVSDKERSIYYAALTAALARWVDSSGRCNISTEGSCDGEVATAFRSIRTGCVAFTRAAGSFTTGGSQAILEVDHRRLIE